MFRYGKLARQAVSAVSFIAQHHGDEVVALSSAEVGKARNIPKALAAKLLSEVASAGILRGTTGPGGGYRLAKAPEDISLMDVVELFERRSAEAPCPFGPGWCGKGEPCPLHNDFEKLEAKVLKFLEGTSFAVFAKTPKKPRGR